jgi:acyl carrier protein
VVACVVAAASTTADQQLQTSISQYAQQHLGHYKLPRQIVLMDELPRNASGKILKTQLRELVLARATPADTANLSPAANVRPPSLPKLLADCHAAERLRVTTRFLQQLVQEISQGEAPLAPHTRLMADGLDSLMLVDLSTQLGVELGQPVQATLVFDYPAIADLAEYLVQQFYPSATEPSPPAPSEALPDLRTEIENMSAAEVLEELKKEVE